MNIHHQNIKQGMILAEGNNRFFVLDVDGGRYGETIVRGTYSEPGRFTEPTATMVFRLNEKAELVGSFPWA